MTKKIQFKLLLDTKGKPRNLFFPRNQHKTRRGERRGTKIKARQERRREKGLPTMSLLL